MVQKLVIKLILIVFVTFYFQNTTAQEFKNNTIPLTTLLDNMSNDYKVFFTYSANLLKNKFIQEKGFKDLSLKESIFLLQKITPFLFDDLGNSYYVIYPKKENDKKKFLAKNKNILSRDIFIDSTFKSNKIIVRGIVLSSDNTPLGGATLQEKESLEGTTTNRDGTFEFETQKENNITISFLGHNSKTISLKPNIFQSITLLSGKN